MKRWILCAGLLFSLTTMADAQNTGQKNTAKKAVAKSITGSAKSTVKKEAPGTTAYAGASTKRNVINSYSAKNATTLPGAAGQLQIADPTIRALHARSLGNNIPISSSGIVGVPKRAYGFANGHILLRRSDATTFGTSTGSGAVGTGSSPGTLGMSGTTMGVNGKSPYAGPDIYSIPITDGREGATTYGAATKPKEEKERINNSQLWQYMAATAVIYDN